MENKNRNEEEMSVAAALLILSNLSAPAPAPAQALAPPPEANETKEQQEESQDSATIGTSSGEGPSRMVEVANENVSSSASSSKPTATRNIRKKRKVRGLSDKEKLQHRLLKKKALYQKFLDACKRALGRICVNGNTAPSSSESPSASPSESPSASPSESPSASSSASPSASPSESPDDGENKNTNTTTGGPRPKRCPRRRPREPTEEDSGNDKKRRKSRLGDFAKKNVIVKIEDSTPEEEWVGIGTGETTIHRDEFQKVKWDSHAVATRSLLVAVFGKETLATHSLTGKKSPAYQNRPAKQCLDPTKVNDIIAEVTSYFPVTEKTIKSIITIKCADECKMERVRVQRAENGEVMSVAAALLNLSELSAPAPSPAPALAPPPEANETKEQQEESQDSATNGSSSGEGPSRMVEEANENVSSSVSSSKPTATRNIRKKRKEKLLHKLLKKALYQKFLDACKRALGRMRVNGNTAPSSSESPSASPSASPSESTSESPSASPSESPDDEENNNTNTTTEAPRPSRRPREPTAEDSGNDKKRRKSRLGDFAKKNVIVKIEDSTPEEEWVGIGTGKTTIHRDEFQKVKWGSHAVATRSLLVAVFGKETLATHSLTGKKSPAYQNRPAKQCLDPTKVNDIIAEVTSYFPVTEKTIKSIITIKCADECKMERVRVQRAENGVK
ncbi:hypothetical protein SFRURICE_018763 [Spodoptera frugiperda]|nr:hypothetical protein SFRURICE_018763 [Spodoptera frugiperda]